MKQLSNINEKVIVITVITVEWISEEKAMCLLIVIFVRNVLGASQKRAVKTCWIIFACLT